MSFLVTSSFLMSSGSLAADDKNKRNFYEVLADVLSDFEYDLKKGEVLGLKNIAVRSLAVSENVPPSFKSHLELSVTEKILQTTKTRMVQCLPCRSKKASLNSEQMIIVANDLNPVELAKIAKMQGINNFMDIAFSYQPNGMILSFTITDSDTNGIIWSKSYNSESSRAAAYRRGVDYSQADDARQANEYIPALQYRAIVYYLSEPDLTERSSTLALGFRLVERYDNRRKEVGFEVNYNMAISTITGTAAASTTSPQPVFGSMNFTLLFLHAWNLIGLEENYNQIRNTITLGVGGTYASGFLGALIRANYEWRLAKHWAVTGVIGYRPKATTLTSGTLTSLSGIEYGLGVGALF